MNAPSQSICPEPLTLGQIVVWDHSVPRAKARVLLIHGLSEHSGRHLNTVNFLTKQEYSVVRFDLRGSGKSGGKRQWIETFNDYVEDVTQVYNWIQRALPKLPLYIYGHSLGGAIALFFTARYNKSLSGLILSAPAYLVGEGVSPIKIAIGQVLVKLTPTLRIPKGTDHSMISRDPLAVEAYKNDPLSFHFNTLKQGDEILKALKEVPKAAAQISVPALIAHGTGDKIIKLEGSYEILRGLASRDKELFIAPHCFHELHNELEEDRNNYFRHLQFWLDSKTL